jgi:hypothetical protein
MTNAFTAKPDLTKFLKMAKAASSRASNGKQASENPTSQQRAHFHNIIKPKESK